MHKFGQFNIGSFAGENSSFTNLNSRSLNNLNNCSLTNLNSSSFTNHQQHQFLGVSSGQCRSLKSWERAAVAWPISKLRESIEPVLLCQFKIPVFICLYHIFYLIIKIQVVWWILMTYPMLLQILPKNPFRRESTFVRLHVFPFQRGY